VPRRFLLSCYSLVNLRVLCGKRIGKMSHRQTIQPSSRLAGKGYNPPSVRILLLSDIHSNLEALDACLAAAPAHDLVVNLGDTVGYGGNPNEVVAKAQSLGHVFVRGNHDKAVSGLMNLEEFNPSPGWRRSGPATNSRPKISTGSANFRRAHSRRGIARHSVRPRLGARRR